MQVETKPFPFGTWEGLLAAHVTIEDDDNLDGEDLWTLRTLVPPGVRVLYLKSVPWGRPEIDAFVGSILSDDRLGEFPMAAVHRAEFEIQTSLDLEWIVDISETMSSDLDRVGIIRAFTGLKHIPSSREVICRLPRAENINSSILDLISEVFKPAICSWLLVDDESWEVAIAQISNSAHPWGVREAK